MFLYLFLFLVICDRVLVSDGDQDLILMFLFCCLFLVVLEFEVFLFLWFLCFFSVGVGCCSLYWSCLNVFCSVSRMDWDDRFWPCLVCLNSVFPQVLSYHLTCLFI